ncbi:hypothetical protein BVY03_02670 [bacterium K02(2017)]|nr:hypothetical protein BVY03_02670 [bacterium K02(2017)]
MGRFISVNQPAGFSAYHSLMQQIASPVLKAQALGVTRDTIRSNYQSANNAKQDTIKFEQSPMTAKAIFNAAPPVFSQKKVNSIASVNSDLSNEEVAEKLFQFILKHQPNLRSFYRSIKESQSLGELTALKDLYYSPTMDRILNNVEQYRDVPDFIKAMQSKKDDLASYLSFWEKLKHGSRLQRSFKDLSQRAEFYDQLSRFYGRTRNVGPVDGAIDMWKFFTRTEELDSDTRKIFEITFKKISDYLAARKRFNWLPF